METPNKVFQIFAISLYLSLYLYAQIVLLHKGAV